VLNREKLLAENVRFGEGAHSVGMQLSFAPLVLTFLFVRKLF
jgi:hypothetical protein